MEQSTIVLTDRNIKRFLFGTLIVIAALMIGLAAGRSPYSTTTFVLGIIGFLAWSVFARSKWWVLLFACGSFGGYFEWTFKVYPHELAVAGCLLPLAAMLALHLPGILQHRPKKLPLSFYLLCAYLVAQWMGSSIYNYYTDQGGFGNVTRAYMNALWVIILVAAFQRYGSTAHLGSALRWFYIASATRVVMGIMMLYFGFSGEVPIIKYALPGGTISGENDLRTSALALASIAICYICLCKDPIMKSLHLVIFFGSVVALLFGAGRGNLVLVCLLPLFVAVLYRRFVPIVVAFSMVGGFVFLLNINPQIADHFPFRVQRSLSIFLLNPDQAQKYGEAGSSDDWHKRLREKGYEKWTSSLNTFLFGTGIRAYDADATESWHGYSGIEPLLESSSKVGAYESGWWTVIAVTGIAGLLLYLNIFGYLLRSIFPELLQNKIATTGHAFAFLGIFGIMVWIVLGWTVGGFPSWEIMYAFLAKFAFDDQTVISAKATYNTVVNSRIRPRPISFARV